MSNQSGGQFSNAPSTPFDDIFRDDNASSSSALLMGHLQNNNLNTMADIAFVYGDEQSIGHSSLNTNQHDYHSVNQQQQVGVATVPMDTGTTSPKEELNQRILEQVQQEYYLTWKSEEGYFTSAYVSPFTHEVFLSGIFTRRPSTTVKEEDGLVWYQTQQESQDAAAARALDCFELREKKQRPYGLRVQECPYELDRGPPLPALVPPEARRFGLPHNKNLNIHAVPPGFSADLSSMTSNNPSGARTTSTAPKIRDRNSHPISELAEFYRNSDHFGQHHKGMTLTKVNFVTWHDGPDHVRRFTCALVCPVSGELFLSGTWTHHEEDCHETNDGLKWYNSKRKAEGAAAAVAHDCFLFRDQFSKKDGVIEEVRFCIEDPYQRQPRSNDEIANLVPHEHWVSIQKLQASSRSGSS